MRLPYGIANFADLRRRGLAYADKTGFIPALESAEKGRNYLVFLRPRRMGKTLLISMLEHYYDLLSAPHFGELFGGLAIEAAPTEERGRYGAPAGDDRDADGRGQGPSPRRVPRPAAQQAHEVPGSARLDEAEAQLRRYLADARLAAIRPPKGWKAVSVAFVATEACWLRELGGEARRLGE
jgi:hypothetical protein